MKFEEAVHEIDVYGFTVVDNVLSQEEVGTLREALKRLAHGNNTIDNVTSTVIPNLPPLDPIFIRLIDNPKILPLVEHFLEDSVILGSLGARIVRPGDPDQAIHADLWEYVLNPNSTLMMNTVWMLDDFTPENGATRISPFSHRSGMNPNTHPIQRKRDVKYTVQVEAPAGSVLVFNGQCWHGGGANRSSEARHALFAHYRKHMMLFQCDPHKGFKEEWLDQLTLRQKQLMRMHKGLNAPRGADTDEGCSPT